MMIIEDEGRILARFYIGFSAPSMITRVEPAKARALLEHLKCIPSEFIKIHAVYPSIGDGMVPLNYSEKIMDLDFQLKEHDQREDKVDQPKKRLFVAPNTDTLPDDGILAYTTIESVYDFQNVADGSVVLISNENIDVLKVVAENPSLFGLRLIVLTGLPTAEYTAAFDAVTWNLERSAYAPLISEISAAMEIEAQLKAQNSSVYNVERSTYVRSTGKVKEFQAFETSEEEDLPTEPADEEFKL